MIAQITLPKVKILILRNCIQKQKASERKILMIQVLLISGETLLIYDALEG